MQLSSSIHQSLYWYMSLTAHLKRTSYALSYYWRRNLSSLGQCVWPWTRFVRNRTPGGAGGLQMGFAQGATSAIVLCEIAVQ